MADQQFCLRWNNHQSTLISVFDTLLENGTLVDCTLAAEGQYLKAHKVVLCACSPYLEALLSQHYEKHPIVILKDVKFSELKSMMDYMYRGEVNISQDQLGTFLKAAESLQIKGLSDNGADGDARDVGSTPKAPPPRKPNVPAPSSRSEPARPDSPLTDGSMSPSSRKRRRVRRSSHDEDSHLENNCDLPSQAQSTPVPNIPAATSSITTTPIVKPAIVKPEQTEINRVETNSLPADVLKKEIEPISEPLLEPKTEYLEDVNNEDSVEDLTLDDDDDMDGMDISNMSNMSNMSRPGPSHGNDISNQGFAAWNLGANQSGTDEVFMAAQEAVNQHRDSQECRMIISSVKSLLEEPDLQETETQSMVAVPIPSAENTFLDLNASVTFEDESSIPQSPVDANLNEDSNAFESVYVPLPVDLYENEGTREGSISCQDQDLSKTEHPTGIRCCDEKGNYLVELSPVKLVNVDQILKSSKPGENMKQDIQTQGTDVVNPSAVAAGEESQKTENGANRRRSFRKRTRPNLLYVADEVTNYLYQRKYRKRNWAQWNNKVSAHLLKTMSSSQVTKHTDQESTMETEIADSSISMSEKTIKSEPSVSKTKLNRIGQKRGRKRKNAVITVKTDSSVSIPEKSIKNEPYVSEEELKTGQKKVQKKHLEKNTVKAENTSSVSIPEENIKSEPSVSNAVTKPYSNAKLKTLQKPKAHGGKPNFKCEQCGKKYYYLRGLRQHLRLECNIPPQFPCPYCPAQYRYRHAIKDHVNSKHPMAYPKWYVNHFVLQPNSANPK